MPSDAAAAADFVAKFPKVDMRVNVPKLGQMRSIDALYASLQHALRRCTSRMTGASRAASTSTRSSASSRRAPDISVVCIGYRVYDPRFAQGARRERA